MKVGDRGRVREIDPEGDAIVKFDEYDVGQLIFQEKFENLQVEYNLEQEAFLNNDMPPFETAKNEQTALPTGTNPLTFRSEQLQLGNRLFVDEELGLRVVADERTKVAGELFLC